MRYRTSPDQPTQLSQSLPMQLTQPLHMFSNLPEEGKISNPMPETLSRSERAWMLCLLTEDWQLVGDLLKRTVWLLGDLLSHQTPKTIWLLFREHRIGLQMEGERAWEPRVSMHRCIESSKMRTISLKRRYREDRRKLITWKERKKCCCARSGLLNKKRQGS